MLVQLASILPRFYEQRQTVSSKSVGEIDFWTFYDFGFLALGSVIMQLQALIY